jgi:hypothetical protein
MAVLAVAFIIAGVSASGICEISYSDRLTIARRHSNSTSPHQPVLARGGDRSHRQHPRAGIESIRVAAKRPPQCTVGARLKSRKSDKP